MPALRLEKDSMRVASAAATMTAAGAFAGRGISARASRGEGGEFLRQLLRAAMRAFGILPVGGADEDFTVALALPAMEFVDGHKRKVTGGGKNSSAEKSMRKAGSKEKFFLPSCLPYSSVARFI
jgi:hypothetical protein